jgi:translation initiation factor IF-2
MKDILLKNLDRCYDGYAYEDSKLMHNFARALTENFIDQYENVFSGLVMTRKQECINDKIIIARIIRLKTMFNFSSEQPLFVKGIQPVFGKANTENKIENINPFQLRFLIDDLYEEISYNVKNMRTRGLLLCPHVVLICSASFDPSTYESIISFRTSYGVIEA